MNRIALALAFIGLSALAAIGQIGLFFIVFFKTLGGILFSSKPPITWADLSSLFDPN